MQLLQNNDLKLKMYLHFKYSNLNEYQYFQCQNDLFFRMKKSPAERLCKWVRYRQDIKHNHELDGTTSKGYESEGFSVSCLIDNSESMN